MQRSWIANRTALFDSSGIRKVFELAAKMRNPINLSIGQPDFDVPAAARQAAIEAIENRKNGYAITQGMPVLREKLQARIDAEYGHADRKLFVSSGTSGGLVLTMLALVNPGDEVIVFDPYFVMYEPLVRLVDAVPVVIDTYPHFHIDLDRVRSAITKRTKQILFNSPANPTGVVADEAEIRGLAELAAEADVALVSDEIYRMFCYDRPFVSPARFNPRTLVLDGFSKSYGMTGWRLGYAHGPGELVEAMVKLQQYSFVCAPQPFQWAGAAALDIDMQPHVDEYRRKRDRIATGLRDHYELETPGGAFYAFPKVPRGTASEFVTRAIENELLIIPGNIFSRRDTHFRVSYAASDETIERGIDVLRKLAG
ncbi:MAG TPA: aminotransferase class I/II-fold pyridoxal phosphate-dependent enzyme [Pirellulales bacterium]|jgi:aspartate aminotransferase/aminotransferase|nr:aminotransferase class I/II-fold pyridoxal phosphate-dependent enzyme [Pirellulales bacterium]